MVVGMQPQQQHRLASPAASTLDAITPCCVLSLSSSTPTSFNSNTNNRIAKMNGCIDNVNGVIDPDTCGDSIDEIPNKAITVAAESTTTKNNVTNSRINRVKLTDVNPHLICVLCHGYFVDATSIAECLHSFCRSCIILYLETKNYCPKCEVHINSSKPHKSLKPDKTLQDIVYKLVPGLFHSEMKRRLEFYTNCPNRDLHLHPEFRGITVDRLVYSPQDSICVSLEYYDKDREKEEWEIVGTYRTNYGCSPSDKNSELKNNVHKKYLVCPAAVRIMYLKKLISLKYNINADHLVEIFYRRESLPDEYSLMDIAYIYTWKRSNPMRLYYRIHIPVTVPSTARVDTKASLASFSCPPPAIKLKCIIAKTKADTMNEPTNIISTVEETAANQLHSPSILSLSKSSCREPQLITKDKIKNDNFRSGNLISDPSHTNNDTKTNPTYIKPKSEVLQLTVESKSSDTPVRSTSTNVATVSSIINAVIDAKLDIAKSESGDSKSPVTSDTTINKELPSHSDILKSSDMGHSQATVNAKNGNSFPLVSTSTSNTNTAVVTSTLSICNDNIKNSSNSLVTNTSSFPAVSSSSTTSIANLLFPRNNYQKPEICLSRGKITNTTTSISPGKVTNTTPSISSGKLTNLKSYLLPSTSPMSSLKNMELERPSSHVSTKNANNSECPNTKVPDASSTNNGSESLHALSSSSSTLVTSSSLSQATTPTSVYSSAVCLSPSFCGVVTTAKSSLGIPTSDGLVVSQASCPSSSTITDTITETINSVISSSIASSTNVTSTIVTASIQASQAKPEKNEMLQNLGLSPIVNLVKLVDLPQFSNATKNVQPVNPNNKTTTSTGQSKTNATSQCKTTTSGQCKTNTTSQIKSNTAGQNKTNLAIQNKISTIGQSKANIQSVSGKAPVKKMVSQELSNASLKDQSERLQNMRKSSYLVSSLLNCDDRNYSSKDKNTCSNEKIPFLPNGEITVSATDSRTANKKQNTLPDIHPEVSIIMNHGSDLIKKIMPETSYDVTCFSTGVVQKNSVSKDSQNISSNAQQRSFTPTPSFNSEEIDRQLNRTPTENITADTKSSAVSPGNTNADAKSSKINNSPVPIIRNSTTPMVSKFHSSNKTTQQMSPRPRNPQKRASPSPVNAIEEKRARIQSSTPSKTNLQITSSKNGTDCQDNISNHSIQLDAGIVNGKCESSADVSSNGVNSTFNSGDKRPNNTKEDTPAAKKNKKEGNARSQPIPALIQINAPPYTKFMAQNAAAQIKKNLSSNKPQENSSHHNALDLSSPSSKSPGSDGKSKSFSPPDRKSYTSPTEKRKSAPPIPQLKMTPVENTSELSKLTRPNILSNNMHRLPTHLQPTYRYTSADIYSSPSFQQHLEVQQMFAVRAAMDRMINFQAAAMGNAANSNANSNDQTSAENFLNLALAAQYGTLPPHPLLYPHIPKVSPTNFTSKSPITRKK